MTQEIPKPEPSSPAGDECQDTWLLIQTVINNGRLQEDANYKCQFLKNDQTCERLTRVIDPQAERWSQRYQTSGYCLAAEPTPEEKAKIVERAKNLSQAIFGNPETPWQHPQDPPLFPGRPGQHEE